MSGGDREIWFNQKLISQKKFKVFLVLKRVLEKLVPKISNWWKIVSEDWWKKQAKLVEVEEKSQSEKYSAVL